MKQEPAIDEFNRVQWAEIKESFKQSYGEYPTVISLLFLVGLSQVPEPETTLTKEQKQDVIHVGLCHLLKNQDIYHFSHFDEDGWPHFQPTDAANRLDIEKQENYIKQLLINYFNE